VFGQHEQRSDKVLCKLCFPLTYQDKKFFQDFFQRSFQTGVLTSRGLYRRI